MMRELAVLGGMRAHKAPWGTLGELSSACQPPLRIPQVYGGLDCFISAVIKVSRSSLVHLHCQRDASEEKKALPSPHCHGKRQLWSRIHASESPATQVRLEVNR